MVQSTLDQFHERLVGNGFVIEKEELEKFLDFGNESNQLVLVRPTDGHIHRIVNHRPVFGRA